MNKLEMAHEWYMKHSESSSFMNTEVEMSWQYVDAMQAEANKRLEEVEHKEGWQPDWSQAPDWAVVWVAGCNEYGEIRNGIWFDRDVKPNLSIDLPCEWGSIDGNELKFDFSEPFGYQGKWQDSLRKRPK